MENCAPVKTHVVSQVFQKGYSSSLNDSKPYRALIGSLMYACMARRPDICAAVNHLSQYQGNPTEEHWKGLKRVLRYIQGISDLGIRFDYRVDKPLVGYAEADFANQ